MEAHDLPHDIPRPKYLDREESEAYRDVVALISQSANVRRIANQIAELPILSHLVLQTANSAVNASAAQVSTVQRAVARLGTARVQNLIERLLLQRSRAEAAKQAAARAR